MFRTFHSCVSKLVTTHRAIGRSYLINRVFRQPAVTPEPCRTGQVCCGPRVQDHLAATHRRARCELKCRGHRRGALLDFGKREVSSTLTPMTFVPLSRGVHRRSLAAPPRGRSRKGFTRFAGAVSTPHLSGGIDESPPLFRATLLGAPPSSDGGDADSAP